MKMRLLLRLRDFQEMYGVSRSTIYRLSARGELELVHVGRGVRIRREEAERWAASLIAGPSNDS